MPDTPPPWLDTATFRLMENARELSFTWGRDALAAADAARQVLLAHRPSLPMPMIEEAVSAVVPDPAPAPASAPGLSPAEPADVASAVSYSLRFGLDGKPRRVGSEFVAPLAAAQIVEQLRRSGYVMMRRSSPSSRPSSESAGCVLQPPS